MPEISPLGLLYIWIFYAEVLCSLSIAYWLIKNQIYVHYGQGKIWLESKRVFLRLPLKNGALQVGII